jgi:hypothetical protein
VNHRFDFGEKIRDMIYPNTTATVNPAAVFFNPPDSMGKNPSFAPSIAPLARLYPKPGRGTVLRFLRLRPGARKARDGQDRAATTKSTKSWELLISWNPSDLSDDADTARSETHEKVHLFSHFRRENNLVAHAGEDSPFCEMMVASKAPSKAAVRFLSCPASSRG